MQHTRKVVKSALAWVATFTLVAHTFAETETVGGVEWSYSIASAMATIKGAIPASGELIIPERLGGHPVTAIGASAFYGCTNLTEVVIPDSVTDIGTRAFYGCKGMTGVKMPNVAAIKDFTFYQCSSLKSVTVPDSVKDIGKDAFFACRGLTNATIGNGVTRLGWGAFSQCTGLTGIVLPESVTEIGENAFAYCSNLTSMTIPGNVTAIEANTFLECQGLENVQIPEGVTRIEDGAFAYCTNLTRMVIPASVASIGDSAFDWCSGLLVMEVVPGNTNYATDGGILFDKDMDTLIWCPKGKSGVFSIPEGVKAVGGHAFSGCDRLTDVTIPDSVTSIGPSAFFGCKGLTNVVLGNNVNRIASQAFRWCRGLTRISIPESVNHIGELAFSECNGLKAVYIRDLSAWCGILFLDDDANPLLQARVLYLDGEEVKDLVIPDNVSSIGAQAFCGATTLTSVTIPDGVTRIGNGAFAWCWSLTNITLPRSMTTIGATAFYGCTNLTKMTIPEYVADIGPAAFTGCNSLTSIEVDDGNAHYANMEGFLFDKTAKSLVWCPSGRSGIVAIPEGVERIGDNAFQCSGLTGVVIPKSMKSIGDYAFHYCDALETIHIRDLVAWCGISFAEDPFPLSWNLYLSGTEVTELVIPDGVVKIGNYAFSGSGLTRVTIPNSVTYIGDFAFEACTNLVKVAIGNNVKRIGMYAFSSCRSLAGITIPDSVKEIDEGAFSGCRLLKGARIGNGVTYVGALAFSGCPNMAILYVPAFWEGTAMVSHAGVPFGCRVFYGVPSAGGNMTTGVPYGWIEENAMDLLAECGGDHEAAAKAPAANGMPVWQCYVAGLPPTDPAAAFKVKSIAVVDGEAAIEWDPDLGADRAYVVEGKASMADEWGPRDTDSRFFRMRVKLPE